MAHVVVHDGGAAVRRGAPGDAQAGAAGHGHRRRGRTPRLLVRRRPRQPARRAPGGGLGAHAHRVGLPRRQSGERGGARGSAAQRTGHPGRSAVPPARAALVRHVVAGGGQGGGRGRPGHPRAAAARHRRRDGEAAGHHRLRHAEEMIGGCGQAAPVDGSNSDDVDVPRRQARERERRERADPRNIGLHACRALAVANNAIRDPVAAVPWLGMPIDAQTGGAHGGHRRDDQRRIARPNLRLRDRARRARRQRQTQSLRTPQGPFPPKERSRHHTTTRRRSGGERAAGSPRTRHNSHCDWHHP